MSVVVTVRDEAAAIDGLLVCLLGQLGPADEVIVVDGGSRDDTEERIRARAAEDGRIRLLTAPGSNIPEGRNAGIGVAQHEVLACTDAGCRPESGWLAALKSAYSAPDPPDLVTGLYEVRAEGSFSQAMAAGAYPSVSEARRPTLLVRLYGALFGRTFDPKMPTGRSVAFLRSAWSEAGGFPEHLATAEDVTFGRTIAAKGGRCVLNTDAVVGWEQRRSLRETVQMYYRYGVGGGRSADAKVVGRDLARGVVYAVGPVLLVFGGAAARGVVLTGAAAYYSLPIARALGRPSPLAAAALVPVAVAVKDLAKAGGCIVGLTGRAGGSPRA